MNIYKINAPVDSIVLPIVFKEHDGVIDVWLRKNIHRESLDETDKYVVADEVYFRAAIGDLTYDDIEKNFEKYWIYAQRWLDETSMTDSEIIHSLKKKNKELTECIIELCSLL